MQVTGGDPNFATNLVSTVAKVTNTSRPDNSVLLEGPAIDETDPYNRKVEIQKNHVGKYQVEVHAEEEFGQETIDRFITK